MYRDEELQRIDGSPGSTEPERPAFRRDYSRLIHSPAFRRLQNKTQLFPGLESDFFRNRLTHSLEVAQIATGIADKLNFHQYELKSRPENQIDRDLIAFAGLAHDLGHPPFGHNGEHALDDMMKKYGGFEGNAQTLRILARLEKKTYLDDDCSSQREDMADIYGRFGLNLTFRSLAAILKYDTVIPTIRNDDDKLVKGYYASEQTLVEEIKRRVVPSTPAPEKFKTVECGVMDVADDIAYSTFDLEDTLKGGFLTPLDLLHEVRSNPELVKVIVKKVEENGISTNENQIIEFLQELFFDNSSNESMDMKDLYDMHHLNQRFCVDGHVRMKLSSWLIGEFIKGVEYKHNPNHPA
jgi:dGTPase